jgi:AraC-like DNA-binding protein
MVLDSVSSLVLLQLVCLLVSFMLAMLLLLSRFQIKWQYRRYEISRWLIFGAMLLLVVHFALQLALGIRAKSDELGALVNILFYTPISIVVSYAIFNVICFRQGRRRYLLIGFSGYVLVLAAFFIGVLVEKSLYIGPFLYVMLALFGCCLLYCILTTYIEMRHHRKIIEEDSAADLLPYDRYTGACYLLVGASVMMLTVGIIYRPALYVVAPLMLLSQFVFVMSFIGYGFNIVPVEIAMYSGESYRDCRSISPQAQRGEASTGLAPERISAISTALQKWCDEGGFRESTINLTLLSNRLGISRSELSLYFEKHLNSSFRIWLSDIRFQVAKRMLRERPNYNNDAISSECGFSSHAHLYKVFKMKTGLTPGQWKEKEIR